MTVFLFGKLFNSEAAAPYKRHWIAILFLALATLLTLPPAAADHHTWILVNTKKQTLSVMQGSHLSHTYRNISIGRAGTTRTKLQGDDKTPLGEFKIAWIREKSNFYRFFGLDYPDLPRLKRAYYDDQVNDETYDAIFSARRRGELPPQQTHLGGFIGIHGIGEGDLKIHKKFNWTNGCVALSNQQIDSLAAWLTIGTRVVIQ